MVEQDVTERTEKKRLAGESLARSWFEVSDVDAIASPALLIYRERVEENLRRVVKMAGGAHRLRPHMKTHKMREMTELELGLGITKFKCATVAEAEMAASVVVPDLLLAYQLVGPNVKRFAQLVRAFRRTRFSVICDDAKAITELAKTIQRHPRVHASSPSPYDEGVGRGSGREVGIEVLLDIDVGQHRTGVPPGPKAVELYRLIAASPGLKPGGLHAYDGHISDPDSVARKEACDAAFAPVMALRQELMEVGLPVPRIVAGGTPTFPIHARRLEVECSPGTCVFWDAEYASKLRDMDFLPAALVLTRVISKPGAKRLCLDLGHKALAAEMPHPRVQFLGLEDGQAVVHSEEHLVVETAQASEFSVGDCLYGVPRHICPTVALHSAAMVIENGKTAGCWKVAARDRRLTI
jgi:D-serine deaminase-like pyridoxal phosphate-dependent protein